MNRDLNRPGAAQQRHAVPSRRKPEQSPISHAHLMPRVSGLCGGGVAGPGVVLDLIVWAVAWPYGRKSGLEELAAELGEHVGGRGFVLGAVPRAEQAAQADVGGVVPGAGVPDDQQRLDQEAERDGALDGGLQPAAGLPDAEDLLAGGVGRLDRAPARRLSCPSLPPERDGTRRIVADWPAREASQSQMIKNLTCPMGLPCCCPGATPRATRP
jgi:hypothetical protein